MLEEEEEEGEEESADDIARIKQAMKISNARRTQFNTNSNMNMNMNMNTNTNKNGKNHHHITRSNNKINNKTSAEILHSTSDFEKRSKLEAQLALRDQEIQFLNKKIAQYERTIEDSKSLFDHKIKAIERELENSFRESQKLLNEKSDRIQYGLSQFLPIVETLERSSLHGRHFVPSETTMSLLLKMKQISRDLNREINTDPIPLNSFPPMKRKAENEIEMTLVEICNSIENENTKLKLSLSDAQDELQILRSQASKIDLIPQYRAAILKYKADTAIFEDNLRRLQVRNEELADRLEKSSIHAAADQSEINRLKEELLQMKEERDQFKNTISRILHQSQSAGDELSGGHTSSLLHSNHSRSQRTNFIRKVPLQFGTNNSSVRDTTLYSEEIVQRDLNLIDEEIGELRRRLEVAAATETQALVRNAIGI